MLPRTRIRQQVVERLLNQTAAAARVYNSRILSIADDALPALVVWTPSEIEQDDLLLISLEIEAFISGGFQDSLGTLIDALCQETLDALKRFWEDDGSYAARYLGTETPTPEIDGRQPIAAARITYEIQVLLE
jgi:hypothetical protein